MLGLTRAQVQSQGLRNVSFDQLTDPRRTVLGLDETHDYC